MTDKRFQIALDKLSLAVSSKIALQELCEAEYQRRYGHHPSDVDNESWIEMTISGAPLTVADVEESVKLYARSAQPAAPAAGQEDQE